MLGRAIDMKRIFLRVLVASLVATGALAIGVVLFAEFDETAADILFSTALLAAFSLVSLPAAVLFDRGRAAGLAYLSLLLSTSALLIAMLMLWTDVSSDAWWRFLVSLVACSVVVAQASATTATQARDDPPSVRWLYVAALGAGALFAAMVCLAAWQKIEDEGYYRLLGAVGVAGLLLTLLQPILRRTSGVGNAPEHDARFVARLDDGRELEVPPALIAELERDGGKVVRIERR
jgi:hypothetical protein